jgi:hypothetical protein
MTYISESRSTIRSHIGRLMFGSKFLADTISAVGANTITLPKSSRFGINHFAGAVLYVVDGPVAGTSTYVASNAPGTGQLTLSPVPAVLPSVGNKVEIWPDEMTPDEVNDAIDMAILDVQHLAAAVTVLTSPTIDVARKRVTVPATWSMVARLTYEDGGLTYKLRPRDPRDPNPWDQDPPTTFDIENDGMTRSIVVWGGVPTSATNLRLVGYNPPTKLATDTDTTIIRSDFVVYKAASILVQDSMATPEMDPRGSGNKATFWAQQAEAKKREMNAQAMSNTARLDEGL